MTRDHYKGVPRPIPQTEAIEPAGVAAKREQCFIISCRPRTVTTARTPVCWLRNDSTSKTLVITEVVGSWNGGSTNHNRTAVSEGWAGMSEPSANFIDADIFTPTDEITAYCWDGVGSGMTITASGLSVGMSQLTQGTSTFYTQGCATLAPGDSVGCIISGEETGVYSGSFVAYFTR